MFGDKRIIIVRGGVKSDEAVIFPSDFAQAMSELYSLAACERKEAQRYDLQLGSPNAAVVGLPQNTGQKR